MLLRCVGDQTSVEPKPPYLAHFIAPGSKFFCVGCCDVHVVPPLHGKENLAKHELLKVGERGVRKDKLSVECVQRDNGVVLAVSKREVCVCNEIVFVVEYKAVIFDDEVVVVCACHGISPKVVLTDIKKAPRRELCEGVTCSAC